MEARSSNFEPPTLNLQFGWHYKFGSCRTHCVLTLALLFPLPSDGLGKFYD
jgi:hypothetical protein